MRVILLGAPGSGKGTQAALLAERFHLPAISTGDMLREAVEARTSLGRRVEQFVAAGELVDDSTMAEVVRERLDRADAASGFILDGYPRTREQAGDLEHVLDDFDEQLDAVVLIEVPVDEVVRRAIARGREDDTEEVVRRRQEVYREQTEPLIGYYRELGLLRPVDGDQTVEQVHKAVLSALPVES
jgi:adenylate kinase